MTTVFDKTVQCVVEVNAEDHKTLKAAALRLDTSLKAIMAEAMHLAAKRLHKAELEAQRAEVYKLLVREDNRFRGIDGKLKSGKKTVSEALAQ